MSASEKINLSEIANISEDEFKKQLLAWIDDRGVSRALQSKLRAELFEQFNRTHLGRQIAVQHQKSHRIELSPLVLVLNTLVAEFLYVENCHFSLSVFSAEVPYKNTLPDFEATTTPTKQLFRLAECELNDIFEAIGMTESSATTIRKFYANNDSAGGDSGSAVRKSLLYCIFKVLFASAAVNSPKAKVKNESITNVNTNSSGKCANCSIAQKKFKKNQISSRYFKYLNRYLDILSNRIREMSRSLADAHSERPSKRMAAVLESNLKKSLDKLSENVNHLTKSKRKSKKLQDFLQSIDRLSSNLETCAGNMERLLLTVTKECDEQKMRPPNLCEPKGTQIDVDYCTWLQELKTSENGRRFVNRLEASLQKTLAKEQESAEKIYAEKMKNYRMLIKLHYKQKYEKNVKPSVVISPIAKRREVKKTDDSMMECNRMLSNALNLAENEKEAYVDRIVQTAKFRLRELENESEKLDNSFQAYLKQQTTDKNQLTEDIANIWQDYTFGKVLLDSHNLMTPRKMLGPHQRSPAADNLRMSNKVLAAEIDALAQLDTEMTFENPFKQFSSQQLFPTRRPNAAATKILKVKTTDFGANRETEPVKASHQTTSSESSYGQLHSPKRNLLNNNKDISSQEKPGAEISELKAAPPVHQIGADVIEKTRENNANDVEIVPRDIAENPVKNNSMMIDVLLRSLAPSSLSSQISPDITAAAEPKEIRVEVKPAIEGNNLPLPNDTDVFVSALHDSATDDDLDESLEISIGPRRNASSSEDDWN